MIRESFDYVDYLSVKKAIDDRSLSRRVWDAMAGWIRDSRAGNGPLRILETGAGTGTMIERLLDAGLLDDAVYTAVELEPGFHDAARARLASWCADRGLRLREDPAGMHIVRGSAPGACIDWRTVDVLKVRDLYPPASFDLVIGHAVIDLLPVPACLPGLLERVDHGGAAYFSLNYAGETRFLPSHPDDGRILTAYHRDMDGRFPGLDWTPSRTGRLLGAWLAQQGHRLVEEGSSDWRLSAAAGDPGTIRFIANILDTIETALGDFDGLPQWLSVRRRQLQAGELDFEAANRDCFCIINQPPRTI